MNTTHRPFATALALAALMALTRSHHAADAIHLPDASWAVFFLAGVFLPWRWSFAALALLAAAVDYAAIHFAHVDSFCVSPAYFFLLPAYGALFLAGRTAAATTARGWRRALLFTGAAFVGTLACELVSSGSFYLFSGRFADLSWGGMGERLVAYFPDSLLNVAFYLGLAALIHFAFAAARRMRTAH